MPSGRRRRRRKAQKAQKSQKSQKAQEVQTEVARLVPSGRTSPSRRPPELRRGGAG
eukprot:CAMPEP_0168711742 /NCGR_PEP_ID=MMETSP0503-20121227/43306_1 /TAXON_ID=89963 /ORGANISM="Heterocapsa rotundata, Strain SCCAP K-0483" /LENGTH=55 /DNA_ID=CAMNT_0008758107 /DNA_START=33 /DNA_END=196 /DNA_ORIENTATION=+